MEYDCSSLGLVIGSDRYMDKCGYVMIGDLWVRFSRLIAAF